MHDTLHLPDCGREIFNDDTFAVSLSLRLIPIHPPISMMLNRNTAIRFSHPIVFSVSLCVSHNLFFYTTTTATINDNHINININDFDFDFKTESSSHRNYVVHTTVSTPHGCLIIIVPFSVVYFLFYYYDYILVQLSPLFVPYFNII